MIIVLRTKLNEARKTKNQMGLLVLPMLIAALQNRAIDKGTDLTEDEAATILAKERAKRLDAYNQFTEAGAHEQAAQELAEAAYIKPFLPEQMDETQVAIAVQTAATTIQATGKVPTIGLMMKILKPQIGNRFPGKDLNELVQAQLKQVS